EDAEGYHVGVTDTKVYDASKGTWSAGPSMLGPHQGGVAVLLRDGGVLVAGGEDAKLKVTAASERLDAALTRWTQAAPLPAPTMSPGGVTLSDGTGLVASGHDAHEECVNLAAIYDPRKNTWRTVDPLPNAQVFASLFLGPDGSAYVIGGVCGRTYFPVLSL